MASEQKDIIRIDNIKLLKVISDPIRKQIIDSLYDAPLTASEIADEINFPKDKIYYHKKKLQSAGILIIAESEKVKGITQNKFLNAARKFEVDKKLLGDEPSPLKSTKSKSKTSNKPTDEITLPDIDDGETDDVKSTDDNPLLASLLKAKGNPVGSLPQTTLADSSDSDVAASQSKPGDGPVRIIADRRRGGDRRATLERRIGKERRIR